MNKVAALIIVLLLSFFARAQNCAVETDALKGTYEGDCKNGKAHGKGTAKGEDKYQGEFKNGYPDGKGNYKWKSGDWYEGSWKKGTMDGKGEMHYANKKGSDSLQTGFWKKGKYLGKYESPYTVHSKTPRVSRVEAIMDETAKNYDISLNAQNSFGGKPTLTNLEVVKGSFLNETSIDNIAKSSITTLRGVTFPFRARIYYNSENIVEIEIFEAGNWKIEITINQ
jgi:hypothetical protein